jgi:nitrite reductase/ring-hydroxylating ferredoxin subunit
MAIANETLVYAGNRAELDRKGRLTINAGGHPIVLVVSDGHVYAVNNRCPHMGFPLDRGSVRDGILTCHWHHARFDLCSGGTFDQWADDVQTYPVHELDGDLYVDLTPRQDAADHYRKRLRDGLERNIRLLIGKAVIGLVEVTDVVEPFRIGLEFGTTYRGMGWGQGLTMHTCFMNILGDLQNHDRSRALFHGLDAVARDTGGMAPRFMIDPLPRSGADLPTLKRWFREFIEVRDDEGAERCLVSAMRSGNRSAVADMLLTAATDHRYIQIGHVVDFINKALEALDHTGWEQTEPVLASLVQGLANANRMEESNAWRNPIDLIGLLDATFAELPAAQDVGQARIGTWDAHDALAHHLLDDDPAANMRAMLDAIRAGASGEDLASAVTLAAGMRVARFHTSNEFGDWDTVLHTFTYSNAVHQTMRRVPSTELIRGVFDAAMSIYLDRFLNMPAARTPELVAKPGDTAEALAAELLDRLDRQQQVNEAAEVVARYLGTGAPVEPLIATLGQALLREDRDFHTVQMVEAAIGQYRLRAGTPAGATMLIACARYLAAHAPTARAQGQTYRIAERLHRGDRLFEGEQPGA